MEKELICKRYEMLCEMLESSPKGLDTGKADLFTVRSNLLRYKGFFLSDDATRDYLAGLEARQAAGEMLGPWRVTSEIVCIRRRKRVRIYTFSRRIGAEG